MSITEKLNKIKSCKEDIKQAIIDKGVDMTDVSLEGYATKISEIQTGGGSGDYLEIKANLKTYSNKDITSLNSFAFANCTSLQSVNIPNVENLGYRVFFECTSLSSIDLPILHTSEDDAFANCTSLQSANIPNMTRLPANMFRTCTSLKSIDLPNVKELSYEVFYDCYALESVNLPICEEISDGCFQSSGLKSIELPKCLKLNWNVFNNCGMLATVNLPKVMFINGGCFTYSRSLSSVYTPIVEKISGGTFEECESLTELDISKTYWCHLEDVGAFNNTPFMNGEGKIYVHNSSLSEYQNDTNWTMFSDCFVGMGDADKPALAFDNGRVYGDTSVIYNSFVDYLGITRENVLSIDLPNVERIYQNDWGEGITFSEFDNLVNVNLLNATYIHQLSFLGCDSLQTVNLPNATYIGENAFSSCHNLQSIDLSNATNIGMEAFESCNSLTEINLPKIEHFGSNAFHNCGNLKTITIGNKDSVCRVDGVIFYNCPLETIYVTNNLVEQYKSDGYWSQYANIIVGI